MWVFYQTFIHINRTSLKMIDPKEVMEAQKLGIKKASEFKEFLKEYRQQNG